MGGLICSSRRQSYLLVCFLTFFNLFFCKIEHLFSSVCIWFKYNWILPNNVLKLGVTWSLTMEVNKSEATRRPHPISTPDFRPKLSECNSSVSLIMQSNLLGGSSLEKCIKSVFPAQVKIWIMHTILQFLAKLLRFLFLSSVGNAVKIDSITFPK